MSEAWSLTDHACRRCLGRVLQAQDGDTFRCSDCGASATGGPEAVCGCGTLVGPIGLRAGRAGSTFRCGPNPRRGPDSPAEIAILFGDPAPAKAEAAP